MSDVLPAILFVVIAALAITVIVVMGANRRARLTTTRDSEHLRLTERAVAAQEATEARLAAIDERLAAMERILKDAE
jgi:hypothetical protein